MIGLSSFPFASGLVLPVYSQYFLITNEGFDFVAIQVN